MTLRNLLLGVGLTVCLFEVVIIAYGKQQEYQEEKIRKEADRQYQDCIAMISSLGGNAIDRGACLLVKNNYLVKNGLPGILGYNKIVEIAPPKKRTSNK